MEQDDNYRGGRGGRKPRGGKVEYRIKNEFEAEDEDEFTPGPTTKP